MQDHSSLALKRARKLRAEMSLPEVLLWQHLRGQPMGVKFRKQHPVGEYILDFYCAAKRVAIEIDGEAHNMGNRPARDARRDQWLASQDIEVVRIAARDVLDDVEQAADAIVRYCGASPPPSALRAATSPSGGGLRKAY